MTRRFAQSFSIIALIIILLYGCATLNSKPVVSDSTFSSDYPKINIKISPSYRYIGHINYPTETKDYQDPNKKAIRIHSAYVYVPKDAKNQMGSGIFIIFTRLANPGWTTVGSAYNSSDREVYRHGVATFAGQDYEAVTHRINMSQAAQPFYDLLMKHGLLATRGFISRAYCQSISSNERMFVYYIEDMNTTGFQPQEWNDKALLKDAQIRFLDDFEKRASKALEIVRN